jgi:hypothetical protein
MLARDGLYNAKTEEEREHRAEYLPKNMAELGKRLTAIRELLADNPELAAKVEQCLAAQMEWKAFAAGFAEADGAQFATQAPLLDQIEKAVEMTEMMLDNRRVP